MRDCRLGCVQAVIERQKRMPAEANDDRLFLDRQHRRSRLLWSRPSVHDRAARLPLAHRLLIDAVTSGERSQALFTMLYRSTDRLSRRGAPVKNLAHSASFDSCHKNAPSKCGTKHLSPSSIAAEQCPGPLPKVFCYDGIWNARSSGSSLSQLSLSGGRRQHRWSRGMGIRSTFPVCHPSTLIQAKSRPRRSSVRLSLCLSR